MARMIDVVEFLDQTGEEIVHREPEWGPGDFRFGSQVIVRENQVAVFFRDGKALDILVPGRHTITTGNIPLLARLIGMATGGKTPFQAEVVFVNTKQFIDQKWGTPEPIWFQDPVLRMARLRARGTYSFQVRDPALFVNKIVGQQGIYASRQIEDYMRGFIVQKFIDLLGEMRKSLFELPAMYNELSTGVKAKLNDDFGLIGLSILAFALHAIAPTEETSKAMEQATAMGAVGEADYLRYQAAQAMRESATAPGNHSEMSTGMGIGTGLGLGAGMAGMVSQAFHPSQSPSHAGGNITLEQVRQAIDNLDLRFSMGEISEENYNRLMKKWQDRVRELGGNPNDV
ncbi:MAG: SPFH domain-containing protein [Chloroflexaceae bacterium]|nr:SPFH domain-containing protein [Chloroflexaceae bacterium]